MHSHFMSMPFQSILAQTVTNGLIVFVLVTISQVLYWGLAHWKSIHKVLIVNTHSQAWVSFDVSLGGLDLSSQQFQESLKHRMNATNEKKEWVSRGALTLGRVIFAFWLFAPIRYVIFTFFVCFLLVSIRDCKFN